MPSLRRFSLSSATWRWAQALGLLCTLALLGGLLRWPKPTLNLLWNVVVPLLPATFLISPGLWRNLCPLASLNQLTAGRFRRWPLKGQGFALAGMALLALLVPARRFLLNQDGNALASIIVAVALLALILGAFFDAKAGFCNALCPVLPVERLYGQAPWVATGNPRCRSCTHCTFPHACLDLEPGASLSTLARFGEAPWWRSAHGVFAAAFPGFILGYATVGDRAWAIGRIYSQVWGYALLSYLAVVLIALLFRADPEKALWRLGVLSIGLYYWFTAPTMAQGLGGGTFLGWSLRALTLGWVLIWALRPALTSMQRQAVRA
jgi:nitrite reductase (NADH) large subunit